MEINGMAEHCDGCNEELEIGQIGLCDECQGLREHDSHEEEAEVSQA